MLRILEIYPSIQGESTWAGLPCVFVRLARCNLRCRWCDTTYSFHGGENWSFERILDDVGATGIQLVEITGGEPLAQKNCGLLCEELLARGYTVLIETSGSLPIEVLPPRVHVIMDIKPPGSGESESNRWENIGHLQAHRDEVKFVISSREDYEWSREVVERYSLANRCRAVLFSPVFGEVEPRDLAEWIMHDRLPVRFQIQLHKILWDPATRGV